MSWPVDPQKPVTGSALARHLRSVNESNLQVSSRLDQSERTIHHRFKFERATASVDRGMDCVKVARV